MRSRHPRYSVCPGPISLFGRERARSCRRSSTPGPSTCHILRAKTDYDPQTFFRQAAFRETNRCLYCYSLRLNATASLAKKSRFDAFTTTLLYSRHQKHQLIASIAEEASRKH
ncbi:MAG: epoxyqueuosine reductase QueH, partial [Thiobacillaceae bacterium]